MGTVAFKTSPKCGFGSLLDRWCPIEGWNWGCCDGTPMGGCTMVEKHSTSTLPAACAVHQMCLTCAVPATDSQYICHVAFLCLSTGHKGSWDTIYLFMGTGRKVVVGEYSFPQCGCRTQGLMCRYTCPCAHQRFQDAFGLFQTPDTGCWWVDPPPPRIRLLAPGTGVHQCIKSDAIAVLEMHCRKWVYPCAYQRNLHCRNCRIYASFR